MLIGELKILLNNYNEDELKVIITELYKAMPKRIKEDNSIDSLIQDVKTYTNSKKKNSNTPVEFSSLKDEILTFIENAYQQNYFGPNNVVRKNERPKWRFKVINYVKALQKIPVDDENGEQSTELLNKLYNLLSYGCAYQIFTSDDPFHSVNIEQCALLDAVIMRKFAAGINDDSVKSAI